MRIMTISRTDAVNEQLRRQATHLEIDGTGDSIFMPQPSLALSLVRGLEWTMSAFR